MLSMLTVVISLIYGLYNASLSGGQGGMIGAVSFGVAIFAGFTIAIENFLVKNSAATNREMLLAESILLVIGLALGYLLLR